MTRVFISVGTNIEREKHAQLGCEALREIDPKVIFSRVYEAEAVGYQGENYFNFIAEIETSSDFATLRSTLKEIEQRYEPEASSLGYRQRCLDLDIILFGDLQFSEPHSIPRDDLFKFAFVLLPMSQLAPTLVVPGCSQTLEQLWQSLSQRAPLNSQSLWAVDWYFKN